MQFIRQSGSYECSYYVMHRMSTIVRTTIRVWDQINTSIQKNTLKFGIYYSCTNSKKIQKSQHFNDQQSLTS